MIEQFDNLSRDELRSYHAWNDANGEFESASRGALLALLVDDEDTPEQFYKWKSYLTGNTFRADQMVNFLSYASKPECRDLLRYCVDKGKDMGINSCDRINYRVIAKLVRKQLNQY